MVGDRAGLRADRRHQNQPSNAGRVAGARKLGSELRNSTAVKRAEELREDASTRLESQIESLFGLLRIASASEVSRLERKVDQLNRKLRELEKGNHPQAAA